MRFTSKQIVTMVVAVSAAVVLAPVGVMAATGQLVNIADPVLDRKARIGSGGTLQVESRAGAMSGAFNFFAGDVQSGVRRKVAEAGYPSRVTLTDLTVATRSFNAPLVLVDLEAWVRTSGTSLCGGPGWTRTTLRRLSVKPAETEQLLFDGPPLVVPAPASGQRVCLTVYMDTYTGETVYGDVSGTGYLYS